MERKRTFFLALSSYFIGYLYVCCMLFGFTDSDSAVEWYALLFAAVFALWGNEIGKEKKPLGKDRLLFLVAMLLIALAISLGRCNATGGWEILALHGAAALWGLYRMGGDLGLEEPLFLVRDTIAALLLLPFGSFFLRIRTVFRGLGSCFRSIAHPADKTQRQSILIVALCLLAALPVLIGTAKLLTQADENFGAFLSGIGGIFQWTLPDSAVTQLIRVLLSLPVSAYLYGLLAGSASRRTPDAAAAKGKIAGMQKLPAAAACGVWGMFAALYVLFFLVQANNLLAVFRGEVPGTLTAANYARSGFFQLCLVMGINFLLLGLGKLLTPQSRAGIWLAGILMVQSLLLAVTAGAKLGLYIHRFGFTPLRLLSAWGVLVLGAGCVLTLLGLAGKKHGFRSWVYFTVLTFAALCFY